MLVRAQLRAEAPVCGCARGRGAPLSSVNVAHYVCGISRGARDAEARAGFSSPAADAVKGTQDLSKTEVGATLPPVRRSDQRAQQADWMWSIINVGAMIGALASGQVRASSPAGSVLDVDPGAQVASVFGRRPALLLNSVPLAAGAVIMSLGNYPLLFVGRFRTQRARLWPGSVCALTRPRPCAPAQSAASASATPARSSPCTSRRSRRPSSAGRWVRGARLAAVWRTSVLSLLAQAR
jgi:hypothetical protein